MKVMSAFSFALGTGLLAVSACAWTQPPQNHPVRQPLPSPAEIAKLPRDGGPEFNRLIFSSSPYLLQHARNPVDWYPWGEQAFAAARAQDKPIFLSIGYSTCHWCHVMEHESFEDAEVARLLNDSFVCIKLDREERPDIDHVYMTFTQAYAGHGGWPMTVWMTPERKPFFAGTYFPKHGRQGRPGMMDLVPSVSRLWKEDRAKLEQQSEKLLEFVQQQQSMGPGKALEASILRRARLALLSTFDAEHGGFGGAPKFPMPHELRFLLREHALRGDSRSLEAVTTTLRHMRQGGLWDHLGYGFHRYSTDDEWLLPHFEKMLYDQALLAMAYTEAWQVTWDGEFRKTVRDIFRYVQRDLRDPQGGFYSAEDADSEGEEGRFYVWTTQELRTVLGEDQAAFFAQAYGFEEEGNFRDEATGRKTGQNILHLNAPLEEVADRLAQEHGISRLEVQDRLGIARNLLFLHREKRERPLRDDKVLTDWNGLMIAALAQAGGAMFESEWVQSATVAAEFVTTHLRDQETGELYKRWRGGEAGMPGLLDDYAFLTWGLIELHQATQDPKWLRIALELTDKALELFWDGEHPGFWMSPKGAEPLLIPAREVYDGAIPSGNSVMLWNLSRLARLTGRSHYEERAQEMVHRMGGQVAQGPQGFTQFLIGFDFWLGPTQEIVLAGELQDPTLDAMRRNVQGPFRPNKVWLHRPPGTEPEIAQWAPFVAHQTPQDGRATAYVCANFVCEAPVTDLRALVGLLDGSSPAPESSEPPDEPKEDSPR